MTRKYTAAFLALLWLSPIVAIGNVGEGLYKVGDWLWDWADRKFDRAVYRGRVIAALARWARQ